MARPLSTTRTVAIPQSLGASPIHKFRRSVAQTGIAGNILGDSGYAFGFTLGQVPNFAEFTALYDVWRIVQVDWHMYPAITEGSLQGATTNIFAGLLAIAVDYDDVVAPSSFNQMLEKEDYQLFGAYDECHLTFKPRTTVQLTSGGSLGTAAQGQWCDCANSGIVHYGLKMVIQDSANNQQTYAAVADLHFEFKNVR